MPRLSGAGRATIGEGHFTATIVLVAKYVTPAVAAMDPTRIAAATLAFSVSIRVTSVLWIAGSLYWLRSAEMQHGGVF